nr:MAG TPA: hypothetical protein [Caudoviricetes sp.]
MHIIYDNKKGNENRPVTMIVMKMNRGYQP